MLAVIMTLGAGGDAADRSNHTELIQLREENSRLRSRLQRYNLREQLVHSSTGTVGIGLSAHGNVSLPQNATAGGPTRPTRARLAVVLSGMVRSFVAPFVHSSIKSNVLDALCAGRGCSALDIFACADLGACTTTDSVHSAPVSADAFLRAFASLSADATFTEVSTENAAACTNETLQMDCTDALLWCNGPGRGGACDRRHVSTSHRGNGAELGLLHRAQCFQGVRRRELGHGVVYDWVIFLRFDVAFYRALPALGAFASRGQGAFVADNHAMWAKQPVFVPSSLEPHDSNFADHFAIVSGKWAHRYAAANAQSCCRRCWAHVRALDHQLQPWMRASGEELLATHLQVHRVPVHFGFYPWLLVRSLQNRSMFSAECFRQTHCCVHTQPGAFRTPNQLGGCWPPCRAQRMAECEAAVNTSRRRSQGITACMHAVVGSGQRRDRCNLETN